MFFTFNLTIIGKNLILFRLFFLYTLAHFQQEIPAKTAIFTA